MKSQYKYYAFISYSHKDSEWAKWLQHELEYYQLPASLNGKPGLPASFRPVFRDEDELAGGDLKPQISSALASSNYLIVICSPHSAQSKYVNAEIREFIELGVNRGDDYVKRIFPFIIDGKPHQDKAHQHLECFPEILNSLSENPDNPIELVAGDVNATGRNHAFVKILAGTLREKDVAFSDLWDKYEQFKIEEEGKRKEAEERLYRANARFIAEKALSEIEAGNSYGARKALLELYGNESCAYPYTAEADKVLRRAVLEDTMILELGREYGRINISAVALSHDTNLIAVGVFQESVLVYKSSNGKKLAVIKDVPCSAHTKMLFSSDDRFLLVTSADWVRLYDITSYEILCEWVYPDKDYYDFIINARFSADDKNVVVASSTGKVYILTTAALKQMQKFHFDDCSLKDFVVHENNIYASSNDGKIRVLDYSNGECMSKTLKVKVGAITLSPDNYLVVTSGNHVRIHYPKSLRLKCTYELKSDMKDEYIDFAYLSKDLLIVCYASEKYARTTIRFYLLREGQCIHHSDMDIKEHSIVKDFAMNKDWSQLLYLTDAGKVWYWSPHVVHSYEVACPDVPACADSTLITKSGYVISAGHQGRINIYDSDSKSIIRVLVCPDDYVDCNILAISPDEKYIVSASRFRSRHMYIWELASGIMIQRITVSDRVNSISFSPDGSKIIVSYADSQMAYEWDSFMTLIEKQKAIFGDPPYLTDAEREIYYL